MTPYRPPSAKDEHASHWLYTIIEALSSHAQLWQLHRLAKDPDCQKLLLGEDAVTTLVPLLTEAELAMGSASILQRLACKEGADKVLKAGKHSRRNMLSAQSNTLRAQRSHALTALPTR